jgi:hypothetical protein
LINFSFHTLSLLSCCIAAESESRTLVAGLPARLPCTASKPVLDALWTYVGPNSSLDHSVYSQGRIMNEYKTRFSVDRSSKSDDFALDIRDVETADAGVYRCICVGKDGSTEDTSFNVAVMTGAYEDGIVYLYFCMYI